MSPNLLICGFKGPKEPRVEAEDTREGRRDSSSSASVEDSLMSRPPCIRYGEMAHMAPSLLSESDSSIQTERPESRTVPDVIAIKGSKSGDNLLTGQTREQLKIVFSRRKRKVLYVAAMFHLPAVSLTLILLGLYISHATWPSPGPSNNVLTSIQFAAKVHEGLAFGSITHIIFHRLRYELMGERGLPFGLVTAAFQITSIPYFFSKQFWSPMRALRCSPHQSLTFTLLVSALVLVLALGPSSAIVMMPKLG